MKPMKIIRIIEFHVRKMKIIKKRIIQYKNHENHVNHRIPCGNY